MLSYNGSIPGPTLRVRQGSEVVVHVRNDGDTEATVHWHGLRLDNAYDGVPFETQSPIEIGGEFTYRLRFPDAGLYWYHPHIREDYGLDMGLYGNIVVEPADADYWPAVDREVVVTLDDVLVEDGRIAAFHEAGPTHVAMGRFGNVMLTGGETNLALDAHVGEVVRFYFTNTANTRLFNVALPGARMKLVGSDSGRYEHETFVDEVLLAPSERAIVDVRFETRAAVVLEHRTPDRTYSLGTIDVTEAGKAVSPDERFEHLRTSDELTSWRTQLDAHVARAARQDARVQVTDAASLRRQRNDGIVVHLPDASRCRRERARDLPAVRDEARPRAEHLCLPDAPRRHLRYLRHLPEVWDAPRPDERGEPRTAHARPATCPRARRRARRTRCPTGSSGKISCRRSTRRRTRTT